jgi:hypothetical protein
MGSVVFVHCGKGLWREMGPHGGCVGGIGVNGEEVATILSIGLGGGWLAV